jgi:hypothetical protein
LYIKHPKRQRCQDNKKFITRPFNRLAEGVIQIVTYLKDYLRGYLDAGRELYIAVQKRAKENCDPVIDDSLSVDELAQQLVTAVEDKQKNGE